MWGQRVLEVSAHSIPSPRPTLRKEKCPGTNKGNPSCQNVVLGRPKSWEKKASHLPRTSTRGSQKRFQAIWASHRGIGGEAVPRKAATSVLNTHN